MKLLPPARKFRGKNKKECSYKTYKRQMFSLSVLIFVLFLSACIPAKVCNIAGSGGSDSSATVNIPIELSGREKENIYKTPFGNIKKGDIKDTVTRILGNPHQSKITDNAEKWAYYFADEKLFIYFIDGEVIEVKEKEDIGISLYKGYLK